MSRFRKAYDASLLARNVTLSPSPCHAPAALTLSSRALSPRRHGFHPQTVPSGRQCRPQDGATAVTIRKRVRGPSAFVERKSRVRGEKGHALRGGCAILVRLVGRALQVNGIVGPRDMFVALLDGKFLARSEHGTSNQS